MATHPLAGKPAPPEFLIDVSRLENDLLRQEPDPGDPTHLVSFGTSGHRGSSITSSFNEAHILAITQAICDYRRQNGIDGPILIGKDTHALSRPAERTAIEVLVANGVDTIIQKDDGYTPTPSISRAILSHNMGRRDHLADGIVITPSHNPPSDGGFKYNPPDGGPADTGVTNWIQNKANHFLKEGLAGIKRVAYEEAVGSSVVTQGDFLTPYVDDLDTVINFEVIRSAGLKIGVDPMGGAAVHYWPRIAERFGIDLTIVNTAVDPRFAFMTLDHDGKIRMDCSSPYAMAGLVRLKDSFDIAFGNDADTDRHGIVAPSSGLMNPNHYLAVAIRYLLTHRHDWPVRASVGKTLVSSHLIDRVSRQLWTKAVRGSCRFQVVCRGAS